DFPGLSASSGKAALELQKARILARQLCLLLDLWVPFQPNPTPGQVCSDTKDVQAHSTPGCGTCTLVSLQLREETGVG
ncbi:hypothetical protein, partial [Pseudomonas gingeri]|uniref:hypothetical protein n=1 Tax=Pseudomonas gingeri TaxID=117681 RepID=UPI001C433883